MKRIISVLLILFAITFLFGSTKATAGVSIVPKEVKKTEVVKKDTVVKNTVASTAQTQILDAEMTELPAVEQEEQSFHYTLKEQFIEGGSAYMAPILLCLIFGLALVIERVIYLNLSSTNTTKLLKNVEDALATGGVEAAKEVCRNVKGPVAGIYYQGLDRFNEGLDVVEKSIVSYGSVLVGRLETNLTWIALFIALAPMLGFLGTVIGMVQAFDAIAEAGDISPAIVASGIKIALLTTVFGLIVAIILQVFYNYILSKIDAIVNKLENSAISFMDIVIKYNRK